MHPPRGIRSESRYFKVLPRRPATDEFHSKRVPKLRPCWAAHTRLGNLGKYPLPPGMTHPLGEWSLSQITFSEILKTVFGPTPRQKPGYAPVNVLVYYPVSLPEFSETLISSPYACLFCHIRITIQYNRIIQPPLGYEKVAGLTE